MKINFWKASFWSGIIARVALFMFEMILNSVFMTIAFRGPLSIIDAILPGDMRFPPHANFDFEVLMTV